MPLALLLLLTAPITAIRLDAARDQQAFRHWFTFLAEAQFFNSPANRPAEIIDCSALIRYAYREALRNHDPQWAASAGLPLVLPFESVAQYNYPRTPTGPNLYANSDGRFSQFADARTLREFNTRFVGRNLQSAQPGDLLFYRNTASQHSMIYIGRSYVSHDNALYVVYHTGPEGNDPGEIRRRDTRELLTHPDPQWRPIPSNPNFLGVYRWNIL